MTSPSRKIIKWGGVLAGSAAVASISAFATTKYLLKMAVDREEPKLMKLAEKRVAGFIEDDAFFKARIEAGDRLSKKASTTVETISHDGILLVGHWIPAVNAKRIIIAVHGWRASWYQTFGIVADSWAANDCSVLYIEQRAHDNSGGEYMGFGLTERFDCLDWVSWVNRSVGADLPIYIFASFAEDSENPAIPLIRYMITLTRCPLDQVDELLAMAKGRYIDELEIPASDVEEDFEEEYEEKDE